MQRKSYPILKRNNMGLFSLPKKIHMHSKNMYGVMGVVSLVLMAKR